MSNDNPAAGGGLPPSPSPDAAQHPGTQHAGSPAQAPASPQHAGSPAQAPASPQHAGSPAQAPASPQHAGSPLEAPQHTAQQGFDPPQHTGSAHTGPTSSGPVQSGQPDLAHATGAQHSSGSHAGVSAGKGPVAKLRHLRHARPRMHMLIVVGGGAAAAVVAVGALAIAKAGSDEAPRAIAATPTTISVVETGELGVPAISTAAAAVVTPGTESVTTEPATTELAPTAPLTEVSTTLPGLASGAGDYAVTVGNIAINGGGFSTTAPGDTQTWTFTGPCDGVGDCSISAGGEVSLSTGLVGSIFSGPGSQVALAPAGNGTYTSTFDIPVDTCGAATARITITVGAGVVTGDYSVEFAGSADCPLTSLSATFTGTAS